MAVIVTHEFDLGASKLLVREAGGGKVRLSIETPQHREVWWALIPVPQAGAIAVALAEIAEVAR